MSNAIPFRRHTRSGIIAGMLCSLLLTGCTAGKRGGEIKPAAEDSTRVADSTGRTAAVRPLRMVSYEEREGAILFGKYCAVCHGAEGKGDGFNSFNLDPRPRDLSDSTYMRALGDDQILQTVIGGGRSVNKSPLMPAYGWTLNRQQLRSIGMYVRSLSKTF